MHVEVELTDADVEQVIRDTVRAVRTLVAAMEKHPDDVLRCVRYRVVMEHHRPLFCARPRELLEERIRHRKDAVLARVQRLRKALRELDEAEKDAKIEA